MLCIQSPTSTPTSTPKCKHFPHAQHSLSPPKTHSPMSFRARLAGSWLWIASPWKQLAVILQGVGQSDNPCSCRMSIHFFSTFPCSSNLDSLRMPANARFVICLGQSQGHGMHLFDRVHSSAFSFYFDARSLGVSLIL